MRLTEQKLKQLIREMLSIGDTMEDLPPEVDELSDFILSIPDDENNNPDRSKMQQAKTSTESLMKKYSDLLDQLRFNMKGKIARQHGPGISSTRSKEYRNMIQFLELFDM